MIYSKATGKKTTKARTKPGEYEAMVRNGFLMPKLNSTIVNKIYMYRVKSGLEYCPMATDIKVYKVCINPPSKDYLLCQIQEELTKKNDERDLTYDASHLPDVEWCVLALVALNPNHHIFDKDYVPTANEKARKGSKMEDIFQEEEIQRFEEFDKGLPSYLHQNIMKPNSRFTGRPYIQKKESMKIDDDTLTDKDFQDENQDIINKSSNKIYQERTGYFQKNSNPNPFFSQTSIPRSNMFLKNSDNLQINQNSNFDIPGFPVKKDLVQSSSTFKPLDLQQAIKQLNTQLFPSNISKNKNKKKLNSQEEEMIVSMFEKLVVNCKGRPVDFVKSYLDQYHSEKKSQSKFQMFDSEKILASNVDQLQSSQSFSNSNFGNPNQFTNEGIQMTNPQQVFTSPNKSKNLSFNKFLQHPIQQFNPTGNQVPENQFEKEILLEDKKENRDINMISKNEMNDSKDESHHFKQMHQTEYDESSNYTYGQNAHSETVQSLSSFNQSHNPNQQIFNI